MGKGGTADGNAGDTARSGRMANPGRNQRSQAGFLSFYMALCALRWGKLYRLCVLGCTGMPYPEKGKQ